MTLPPRPVTRRDVKIGREPKATQRQKTEARQRLAKGETTRDLAESYSVSLGTISRLMV